MSNITEITRKVMIVTFSVLLLPTSKLSLISGAAPLTEAFTPAAAGVCATRARCAPPVNPGPNPRHRVGSCGLVQAGDVSVHVGGGPFVLDDVVDGDAATDGVSVPLRAQVGEERGVGRRQRL